MKDVYVIVPSYNPDETIMFKFINELKNNFNNILIVNDGSEERYDNFFKQFEKDHIVLKHSINQGKGRAMKTAFNYLLNETNFKAAVTADCDGQHSVEDIKRCAEEVIKSPNSLIIGARDFNQSDVPRKSKFGNIITRNIFKIFIGLIVSDTQTGLRGFSKETTQIFLKTKGERYEYETNMLIDCKELDIKIKELKIKTIYINNNKTSHFNPLKDSIMIYKLFVKYILASFSSFLVDIIFFSILINLINIKDTILISTIIARVISSIYNFLINKKIIFKKSTNSSIYKYFTLVIIQMFVSAFSVSFLNTILLNTSTVFIKILVDAIIFVINFIIQREWVFKKS